MSVSIVGPDTMHFCNICSKPIVAESAFKRHLSYCRRTQGRPRKRPRSCKECHSAKAKCSFEPECSRCKSRGLNCVYEKHLISTLVTTGDNHRGTISGTVPGFPSNYAHPMHLVNYSPTPDFGSTFNLDVPATSPRSINELSADPVARHGATFILESFQGLPFQMISRETFSWYMHGYWYQPELPRSLARCTKLAALYAEHQPPKDSFWSLIEQENRWLLQDLPHCSLPELIYGMQVQIVYMIMFALGHNSVEEIPQVRLQMLMTFDLYGNKCSEIDSTVLSPTERFEDPAVSWEDWLYAETRRRLTISWFLLSRVMDLKFGVMCPSISNCWSLPLPSPDSLWNAKTRDEWETSRKVLRSQCRWPSLQSFGDLIEARSCPRTSELVRERNKWHASCDKLGLLLALATTMV